MVQLSSTYVMYTNDLWIVFKKYNILYLSVTFQMEVNTDLA